MNCQPALQNTRQETKLCGNSSAAASLRHSEIENTQPHLVFSSLLRLQQKVHSSPTLSQQASIHHLKTLQ